MVEKIIKNHKNSLFYPKYSSQIFIGNHWKFGMNQQSLPYYIIKEQKNFNVKKQKQFHLSYFVRKQKIKNLEKKKQTKVLNNIRKTSLNLECL